MFVKYIFKIVVYKICQSWAEIRWTQQILPEICKLLVLHQFFVWLIRFTGI